MAHEREIAEEQAFLDVALDALDRMRADARSMRDSAAVARMRGAGDLVERDVVMGTALHRLDQLAIGDQPLFFGRLDYDHDGRLGEVYRVGRLAISDEDLNALVVDWRAPVAEAFYRATAVEPLGLARRRHVALRGHEVVGVEDEHFIDDGRFGAPGAADAALTPDGLVEGGLALGGPGALLAALGRARTGHMGDIIATIQAEQDRIIRAPLPGIMIVQGGPGTGKTAVALHRAAYLLYTHRATLERQGVLVVGPNPLFLTYIANVLPSLGESGVTMATVAGLVVNVEVRAEEPDDVARLKGDARMARVIERAVRTRQRSLRHDVMIPLGRAQLTLSARDTREVVERARRRPGNHNQRRSALGRELASRVAARAVARFAPGADEGATTQAELADQIRATPEFQAALQRIWPRLSGQELLHDLFGAAALVRAAGASILSDAECDLLVRSRAASPDEVRWTAADAALIDEARVHLGPRRRPRPAHRAEASLAGVDLDAYSGDVRAAAVREAARLAAAAPHELDEAEFVTYGHIVVDEAQDLSAMELRVLARRDLSGSLTLVGDMGQATSAGAAASWDTVIAALSPRRPPTRIELTVSYRTPEEVLDFAAPTLAAAAPTLVPPRPVRRVGVPPTVEVVAPAERGAAVAAAARREREAVRPGRTAVIAAPSDLAWVRAALAAAGLDAADPSDPEGPGLDAELVVVPTSAANGLEFDAVIVVEPATIVAGESGESPVALRGLRTLYVALTRPTRRLAVVASRPLPATLL